MNRREMHAASIRALQDAVLRAVADRPGMTTHEVIAAVFSDGAAYPYRYYPRVYSNLRTMAKQNRVQWVSWGQEGDRTVWRPVEACDVPDVAELETMWRA